MSVALFVKAGEFRVLPEPGQLVVFLLLGEEDMDDEVAVIQQDPAAGLIALDSQGAFAAVLAFGDRTA